MIKDCTKLRDFEKRMICETNNDFQRNIGLHEAMYKYSKKMLAGRNIDSLEGIGVDIRIAKVINSV